MTRARTAGLFILLLACIVIAWFAIALHRRPAPPWAPLPQESAGAATSSAQAAEASSTAAANTGDTMEILSPQPNAAVNSPLEVRGQAKGPWFFEGQFPVELVDAQGTVIASTSAHALGDWTTADFVPFSAALTFAPPATDSGLLIVRNDNPSGDPSKDIIFAIPVRFK